jgi:tRNA threonylcarbamoyladenosine biosynthesis protein TsaB
MKLLAIETSSFALHHIAPQQQSQMILPMIDELLKSKNIALNQLDVLAFGCGPGSFTGVRIATSVTQGLAYALNLPVIPISSLAALAQTAYQKKGYKKILVAVDARIQEVYWAAYEVNDKGLVVLREKEHVSPPEDITVPDDSTWSGAGNAWEVYKDHIIHKPIELYSSCLPTAAGVAQLAKEKYDQQAWVYATDVHPTYLRNNVAKKS